MRIEGSTYRINSNNAVETLIGIDTLLFSFCIFFLHVLRSLTLLCRKLKFGTKVVPDKSTRKNISPIVLKKLK